VVSLFDCCQIKPKRISLMGLELSNFCFVMEFFSNEKEVRHALALFEIELRS